MPLAPALQQVLDTLLSSLYNLQTSIGGGQKRYYSAIFRDLPDRQLYPDYYVVIKNPRCLHDIMVSPSSDHLGPAWRPWPTRECWSIRHRRTLPQRDYGRQDI